MEHRIATPRSAIELAAALRGMGLSKSYASELANGRRRPSLGLAARIETELNIPAATWASQNSQRANSECSEGAAAVKQIANEVRSAIAEAQP